MTSAEDRQIQNELREAWGLQREAPLLVIGRLTGSLRDDLPDLYFLNDFTHPSLGHGLVYPQEDPKRGTQAFIPPREIPTQLSPKEAISGTVWAIAELELAPPKVREQRNNQHECNVRAGTLRLLRELPDEWEIDLHGPIEARRIASLARDNIEASVRTEILNEANELAHQAKQNNQLRLRLFDELKIAQQQSQMETSNLEAQIAQSRQTRDIISAEVENIRVTWAAENEALKQLRFKAEQERITMEERYRKMEELLAKKGDRLLALGLIDKEDLELVSPKSPNKSPPIGTNLDEAFSSDVTRLVPWLQARLAQSGLLYSQDQLRNFIALLRTRDLIVLAGDSGSGKTSLIRAVAEAVGGVCTIIPVKPNWTGPEDLLGYYNPIERSYHPTPFLLALQAAARTPDVPHFICLDEMNLARVEHYFADFLSLLEKRTGKTEIHLYTADEDRHLTMEHGIFLELEAEARRRADLDESATLEEMLTNDVANNALHQLGGFRDAESVLLHHSRLRRALSAHMRMPTSIELSENVWVLGAVNMDETTHHFSPKVLDRLHVLRFNNPMLADWEAIDAEISAITEDPKINLTLMPSDIGSRTEYPPFDRNSDTARFLANIARDYLDPLGIEFGLRAVRQSLGYLKAAEHVEIEPERALDNVIRQKILPKISLDTSRPTADGQKRRDVLVALRDALAEHLNLTADEENPDSSIRHLDRLITLADGNNRVANFWMR